jgi:transcription initiation factor TFIID subunit 13
MYAFGDDPEPLAESVQVLDEIVTEYIVDMVRLAYLQPKRG